jgi:cytochrome P450
MRAIARKLVAMSASPLPVSRPRLAKPIPRYEGPAILGHFRAFRRSRTALQLAVARAHPEIARVRIGLFDLTLVNAPALAHEILVQKEDAFVKSDGIALFLRPLLGDGLLTSEHGFHARQRRAISPAFTHKRIAGYAETMAARAYRVARAYRAGDRVDAAEDMSRLTLEIVCKTLFDAEIGAEANEVGDAVTEAMTTSMASLARIVPIPPAIPTPQNLRFRRAVARLDAVLFRMIAERRRDPRDRGDLLSILLAEHPDDGSAMSDQQVRDEAMTLFLAGHETTANALAWSLYLLARHPAAADRAEDEARRVLARRGGPLTQDDLKDLPYTLAVLKESMRLYPPAYLLGRRVTRNVTIGGYDLHAGNILFVNILGMHHRPDLYPDPHAFDPTRFLADRERDLPRCAYMPFGAGPRVCIGNHFALMEGHIVLATLLGAARFELQDARPVDTQPLVTLRPRGGVPLRVARAGGSAPTP